MDIWNSKEFLKQMENGIDVLNAYVILNPFGIFVDFATRVYFVQVKENLKSHNKDVYTRFVPCFGCHWNHNTNSYVYWSFASETF